MRQPILELMVEKRNRGFMNKIIMVGKLLHIFYCRKTMAQINSGKSLHVLSRNFNVSVKLEICGAGPHTEVAVSAKNCQIIGWHTPAGKYWIHHCIIDHLVKCLPKTAWKWKKLDQKGSATADQYSCCIWVNQGFLVEKSCEWTGDLEL